MKWFQRNCTCFLAFDLSFFFSKTLLKSIARCEHTLRTSLQYHNIPQQIAGLRSRVVLSFFGRFFSLAFRQTPSYIVCCFFLLTQHWGVTGPVLPQQRDQEYAPTIMGREETWLDFCWILFISCYNVPPLCDSYVYWKWFTIPKEAGTSGHRMSTFGLSGWWANQSLRAQETVSDFFLCLRVELLLKTDSGYVCIVYWIFFWFKSVY